MRKKESLEIWNKWFTENYDELVSIAKTYHTDATDLVHHVYLRVYRQNLTKVMNNPKPYFKRAMFIEGTRGRFKKQYIVKDTPEWIDVPAEDPSEKHFMLENIELIADKLTWFDKTILHLWIDGFNICEVARESGIPQQVLHTTLHRTKKKIKDALSRK